MLRRPRSVKSLLPQWRPIRRSIARSWISTVLPADNHANVNQPDSQKFTPLFWAVDRRNMETAPNFPWIVTTDPLPLIKKLLDAGADVNFVVNNTPRGRMRDGTPRIVFA